MPETLRCNNYKLVIYKKLQKLTIYLAYATERVSRITVILTCPG